VDDIGWRPDPGLLDRFGREVPDGLYGTKDFERVLSLLGRTEAVARHLTDYLRKTSRYAETIVFCVDQEHAEDMRKALINCNTDITRKHPDYVVRVVSDEGQVGRRHLDKFQDPEQDFPVIRHYVKTTVYGRGHTYLPQHRPLQAHQLYGRVQAGHRSRHTLVRRRE